MSDTWGKPGIGSINGAQKKGDDGFHDPTQTPPQGFSSWAEVGAHNEGVGLSVRWLLSGDRNWCAR